MGIGGGVDSVLAPCAYLAPTLLLAPGVLAGCRLLLGSSVRCSEAVLVHVIDTLSRLSMNDAPDPASIPQTIQASTSLLLAMVSNSESNPI